MKKLKADFKSGSYDSVCGDRWRARGTFREFVVPRAEMVYPEWIVYYKRHHEARPRIRELSAAETAKTLGLFNDQLNASLQKSQNAYKNVLKGVGVRYWSTGTNEWIDTNNLPQ